MVDVAEHRRRLAAKRKAHATRSLLTPVGLRPQAHGRVSTAAMPASRRPGGSGMGSDRH